MHDFETIIDAAFDDRASIDARTQGAVRDAVEAALHLLERENSASRKRSRGRPGQALGRSTNG